MKVLIIAISAIALALLVPLGLQRINSGSSSPSDPPAVRAGREASDFSIKLFSGQPFRLSEQRGKVVLVNFWASWCVPCRDEAPVLERAWENYKDRGVVFVGLDVWDSEPDAKSFMHEFGITYPTGPDQNADIAIDYGVSGVPESWFLDRQGRLVRRWIGPLNDQQIKAFIEEASR